MDLTLLRSFVTVAEMGTFSGAAQRLNVTQSTISHQIARLEEQIGRRLLERTTRKCRLTSVGRELLGEAQEIVRRTEEIQHRFQRQELRGRVRLGIPDDFHLFSVFTEAITEFSTDHPQVTIDIVAGLSADLDQALDGDDLDLAILRKPHDANDNSIIVERLVWVGKSVRPRPQGADIPLALVSEPCLYRSIAIKTLTDHGLGYRHVATCSNISVAMAFVEAGIALSVVLRAMLPLQSNVIEMVELPRLPQTSIVFRSGARIESVLTRELKSCLSQKIKAKALTI